MRKCVPQQVAIPLTHLPHADSDWRKSTRLILAPHERGAPGREIHFYVACDKVSGGQLHGEFSFGGTVDFRNLVHERVNRLLAQRQILSLKATDLIGPLLEDELTGNLDLSEISRAFGISLGSGVPIIHLSGDEKTTFVSTGYLLTPSDLHGTARDAFLWNMCSGVAACLQSTSKRSDSLILRPNELECIKWAVAGKTLREIAKITGINYRTVRFYIDSARERYGYATNTQLYVRAALDYNLEPPGAAATNFGAHANSNVKVGAGKRASANSLGSVP